MTALDERRQARRPPARVPPPRRPPPSGTAPAGRALQVMVGALVLALVFDSRAVVRSGEAMPSGRVRTLVLALGRPVDTVAHALFLDRPRRLLDSLLGNAPAPTGRSELTAPATGGRAAAPARALPALRRPTSGAPLRLLVTGDSMTEFLGPVFVGAAGAAGKARGRTEVRYGTGLVRPDFFDWSIAGRRLLADHDPEAVVVMMGGNDGQGMTVAGGRVLRDSTPEWTREYQRRAEVVMRVFADRGTRRVYWVGMPVARSTRLAADYALIDRALAAAAARVPGATFLDIAARLSDRGRYSAYLPDDSGHRVLVRARDGIHLSHDGARIAAQLVLRRLDADWHLLD